MPVAALCSNCDNSTSKIYEPYWCADCKIEALESELLMYKERLSNLEANYSIASKKALEANKYRNAFEALVEIVKNN